MGHKSNLSKFDKRGLKKEKIIFWGGETRIWSIRESEKVREKENKKIKNSFFDSQSYVGQNSSSQE